MKKLIVACISFLILIIIMFLIIVSFRTESIMKDENKIQIVATLFPQYDFAKQIVGDKAEVRLLLDSGVESHNYEPTAKDMITMLDNTDIFLFTGTYLEPWTEDIIQNLKESDCEIIDLSKNIELIKIEEFEERHINSEILIENHYNNDDTNYKNHESQEDAHNHEIDNKENYSENIDNHGEENHHDMYDGHIWQSPLNAIIMLEDILDAICEIDSQNAEYYKKNAEIYKNEIIKLDDEIKKVIENSEKKEIAVGGEFAYAYFIEQYDLKFVSVYTNCGHGEDPSIAKVKSVIDYINKYNIPAVFYEELSEGTVAKMIAEETEAVPLVLYSIHNGNIKQDTYISLMKKNIENLKTGLSYKEI